MKSVVFDAYGSPGKVLRIEERPLPEPGSGQVRARLVLSPIHNHDLMIVTGHYGVKPPLPHNPGTEALGIVDKLGEGVTGFNVGDRVSGGAMAAWSEFYLASAAGLAIMPASIDDATACQITSMPMSAVRLLADLEVKPGDWIAQNAANGAVGKLLAKLAAEKGIRVLNVVRREEAVAELAAEGIGDAVSSEHEDWQERARAITGGAPVIRAVDSVGGRASDELMDLVAEEGRLVSFGALSGRPLQVTAENLLFKRTTISGFWGARPERKMTPAELGAARADLIRRASEGTLKLPIAEVFELDHAAEAAEASGVKGRPGKIGLRGDGLDAERGLHLQDQLIGVPVVRLEPGGRARDRLGIRGDPADTQRHAAAAGRHIVHRRHGLEDALTMPVGIDLVLVPTGFGRGPVGRGDDDASDVVAIAGLQQPRRADHGVPVHGIGIVDIGAGRNVDNTIGALEGGLHVGCVVVDVRKRRDDVGAGHAINADAAREGSHEAAADIAHRADDDDGHAVNPNIWSWRWRSAKRRVVGSGAAFAAVNSWPFFTTAVTLPPSSRPTGIACWARASAIVMVQLR